VKRDLNGLLGQSAVLDFEVSDSIIFDKIPDKNELQQKFDSSNTNILYFRKQIDIARLNVKENNRL
jgi:hypothetical protein